jgi:hypothetical protein
MKSVSIYFVLRVISLKLFLWIAKGPVVRPTARHAIHLPFDISANALEIRAVQSLKCLMCY